MTTLLPTRALGTSGMDITTVGFGAWATGGGAYEFGWGPQDDAESIAAIQAAVTGGVNWIDTAAVYGLGHSEEVVGRAVRGIPAGERPYVFTKCGMVWATRDEVPRRAAEPAQIRRELDASLRRLGVERIDLYQVHWPPEDGTPIEAYWQTMLDLKAEGKIRAAGLSNHSAAELDTAERLGHVDTLQPPFSAIRRDTAAEELPWCAQHGTGAIVYSPMQSGLLTGGFSEARVAALPADDWRSRSPLFHGDSLRRSTSLANALAPIADRLGVSQGAMAIAWTLAWPGVTGAIVGARTAAQVEGWLPAAALTLSSADLDTIAAAIATTAAGTGPSRPPR
jgi:aryl-alcohol dehydrogenase-like predicted oxidoreductase